MDIISMVLIYLSTKPFIVSTNHFITDNFSVSSFQVNSSTIITHTFDYLAICATYLGINTPGQASKVK